MTTQGSTPTTAASEGRPVKRAPQRRCVTCGEHAGKRDLLRVVRTPQGGVTVDPKGKAPGRGAYVCGDGECALTAVRRGRLEHALKVRLSPEARQRLEAELAPMLSGP